jgi:beta-mannosidase
MRTRQELQDGWAIKQLENDSPEIASLLFTEHEPAEGWMPARMPAQVHDILFRRGIIPDPHVGKNAAECTWVGETDWAYTCSFSSPSGQGPVFLRFNGLDTLAKVFLNGELIAQYDNMNRRYNVEVRQHLRPAGAQNSLVVIFSSPLRYIRQQEEQYGKLEGIPNYMYIRKSMSDFSSYLGARPCFPKVGIFASVMVDVPDRAWIEDVCVRPQLSEDFTQAKIDITFTNLGQSGHLEWTVMDPQEQEVASGSTSSQASHFEVSITAPHLWWPRTHGKPELYTLHLRLLAEGQVCDATTTKFGIRKIRMILKDAQTDEHRFAFEVNGQAIFLRGACLAPLEGMTHCWSSERSQRLLDLAEHAHMNVLRVWGDGVIHEDEFYEECDRRGFLVWQDFMFGYGMQPTWLPDAAQKYQQEIEETILRLRNHPCIFLWCGGNENLMAWDFAFRRPPTLGRELFYEMMPQAVARLDPDRPFHLSSPALGRVPNWPLEGDWHDYSRIMWSPHTSVPLFASEVGRVSPPSYSSMQRYLSEDEIWPKDFDPSIRTPGQAAWPPMWEYRTVPGSWVKVGAVEEYCDPAGPQDLIRNLGTAHGEYLQRRVERHRRGIPDGEPDGKRRCWGNMIWRLNDTWPIAYWALIDYYLEPKIAYYFLRRAYAPKLLSFEHTPDAIHVWVVNDSPDEASGKLTLSHKRFDGTVIGELSQEIQVPPGAAYRGLDAIDLGVIDLRTEFLQASFNGLEVTHLLIAERYLHLPQASLSVESCGSGLVISSNVFARQVTLSTPGMNGTAFEDNFFDLAPAQSRTIQRITPGEIQEVIVKALNAPPLKMML